MSTQTRPALRAKSRRPLAVLIDEATEHLADLGYHPATITGHRAFWTRLAWMAGPDGLAAPLSKELAARFLASYGVTPDRIDDRLDSGPGKARTAILHNVLEHIMTGDGFLVIRRPDGLAPLPAPWPLAQPHSEVMIELKLAGTTSIARPSTAPCSGGWPDADA